MSEKLWFSENDIGKIENLCKSLMKPPTNIANDCRKTWRMSSNDHWKLIARISTNDLGKNHKFCTGIMEKNLHFRNDCKNSQILKRATVKILNFSNRKKILKQLLNKNVNFLEWLWETFYFDNSWRKKSRISSK